MNIKNLLAALIVSLSLAAFVVRVIGYYFGGQNSRARR